MSQSDDIYRNLQEHLDENTVGFPPSKSGADIRVLMQLFTPEQAEVAMLLSYKYESITEILVRAKKNEIPINKKEFIRILDETAIRRVIGCRNKDNVKQYRNIPYIIGMAESASLNNPNPDPKSELVVANTEYIREGLFIVAFITSKVPQMRVIPINHSIKPENRISTYDEIKYIIEAINDPIVIIPCVCRMKAKNKKQPCKKTSRTQTCMVLRDGARYLIESELLEQIGGQQITKEEAHAILRENEEDGLIFQPSNAQDPNFICSCCGCCCGMLRLHKAIPNPVSFWASNFYSTIDSELCDACGNCANRCPVEAIIADEKGFSTIDLTRCLGCGTCVSYCPNDAIELHQKEIETVPPQTGEDMTEIIVKGNN